MKIQVVKYDTFSSENKYCIRQYGLFINKYLVVESFGNNDECEVNWAMDNVINRVTGTLKKMKEIAQQLLEAKECSEILVFE